MKVKNGFILKNIADEWVVMPTCIYIKKFEGAIILNDIAAFIWKQLEKHKTREELIEAVLGEYDIDEETAAADIDEIIDNLRGMNILIEN